MCLEDLRLGRGRHVRRVQLISGGMNGVLQADASRVSILWTFSADEYYDPAGGVYINTKGLLYNAIAVNLSLPPAVYLGPKSTQLLMRVEDYGDLVTGPWSFLQLTSGGSWALIVADVYTEVNAPPMDTYKP